MVTVDSLHLKKTLIFKEEKCLVVSPKSVVVPGTCRELIVRLLRFSVNESMYCGKQRKGSLSLAEGSGKAGIES